LTWHAVGPVKQVVWDFWLRLQNLQDEPLPPPFREPCSVYIDGSCTDMKDRLVRLSGAAVVRRNAQYQATVICQRTVPGIAQSSGRAEVFAGLLAVQTHTCATIYSDYQLFVARANCLLQGGCVGPFWTNRDLWCKFKSCISQPHVQIAVCKTKAHGDWKNLPEPMRERGWFNDLADCAAKKAVENACAPLRAAYVRARDAQTFVRSQVCSYQKFLAAVAERKFELAKKKEPRDGPNYDLKVLHVAGEGRPLPVNWPALHRACLNTHWPKDFLDMIASYFAQLRWFPTQPASIHQVSWVELYLDWLMWTGCVAPARMPWSRSSKPDYRWRHSDGIAQVQQSQLGVDVYAWKVAFKFLVRKGALPLPFNIVTRAWSVRRIGLLMKHGGLDHRPFLLCGNAAAEWLQRRLKGDRYTQKTLKFSLLTPPNW